MSPTTSQWAFEPNRHAGVDGCDMGCAVLIFRDPTGLLAGIYRRERTVTVGYKQVVREHVEWFVAPRFGGKRAASVAEAVAAVAGRFDRPIPADLVAALEAW